MAYLSLDSPLQSSSGFASAAILWLARPLQYLFQPETNTPRLSQRLICCDHFGTCSAGLVVCTHVLEILWETKPVGQLDNATVHHRGPITATRLYTRSASSQSLWISWCSLNSLLSSKLPACFEDTTTSHYLILPFPVSRLSYVRLVNRITVRTPYPKDIFSVGVGLLV